MIRLSRMADYGIVLLTHMATGSGGEGDRAYGVFTAKALADHSGLPLPTVSKVLKRLARAHLLTAHRGKHGGYSLAKNPDDISVAEMITAIDGPIALTDCSPPRQAECSIADSCPNRSNWTKISAQIKAALGALSLNDMKPGHFHPEANEITQIGDGHRSASLPLHHPSAGEES